MNHSKIRSYGIFFEGLASFIWGLFWLGLLGLAFYLVMNPENILTIKQLIK